MDKVPIPDREYWRPAEAAAVLGRSAAYWTRLFKLGVIRGYQERGIHLQAASCRRHLERLCDARQTPADTWAAETKAIKAEFRARWKRQGQGRVDKKTEKE